MSEPSLAEFRDRDAENYLQRLLDRAHSEEKLELDLRPIKRVSRFGGALLTNTILGLLREHELLVRLPADTYRLGMLARSSLLFALANHSHVRLQGNAVFPIDSWKQNWVPGSAPTPLYWTSSRQSRDQLALFQPEDLGEGEYPSVFGPYNAAFVNAHLATLGSIHDELSDRVIWPWLTRLLPTIQNAEAASDEVKDFVKDVGSLVDELLENVAEHAAFRLEGHRRRPSSSLVQVSVTRGGRSSYDRLYLSVQDTGPGIEATARPKLLEHSRDSLSAADLVHGLFEGSIDSWPERRGRGLPRVLQIYQRWGHETRLMVASENVRLSGNAGEAIKTSETDLAIPGTVVVLMMPLPIGRFSEYG